MSSDLSSYQLLNQYLDKEDVRTTLIEWENGLGRQKQYELNTGINYSSRTGMFLAECGSAEAQDGIGYGYFILNGYSQIVIRAIKAGIHEAIKEHHFNRRKIALILDKAFDPEWTKTLGGITFETMQAVTIRVAEVCACEK